MQQTKIQTFLKNKFSQTAWHIQDEEEKNNVLLFGEDESYVLKRAGRLPQFKKKQLKVKRAEYADNLKNDIYTLRDVMAENGWRV